MAEPLFDISVYLNNPSLSLAALTVLAQTLVLAAPRDLPALVKRALAKLTKLAESGQVAQLNRLRQSGIRYDDKRAVDLRADRAVGFIRARLEHYALLVPDEFPLAPRAAELGQMLFPDGLNFLMLPYVEQLAVMEVLIARIDEDKLNADLQTMCGADLVLNLRRSVHNYRDMVQSSLQKVDDSENLHEYRRQLSVAIGSYATKVAALYEEEDPQSLERVKTALQPIQAMRAQLAPRASATDAEPAEPEAPAAPAPQPPDAEPNKT